MTERVSTNPLFIIGVARSGTSYLFRMVNRHPDIRLTYESRIVKEGRALYERFDDLSEREPFFQMMEALLECENAEPQNQWLVRQARAHRDQLYDFHQKQPGFAALLEAMYMLPEPVACWGSKVLRMEFMEELLRNWPEARVVVLMRDPRAVYASKKKKDNSRVRACGIYWTTHAQWVQQLTNGDARYLVLKFEDLVTDLTGTLRRIFAHAGVPGEEEAERIAAEFPFDAETLGKWKNHLSNDDVRLMESVCYEHMRHWGYEPLHATRQVHLGPLTRGKETFLEYAWRIPWDIGWWRRKRLLHRFINVIRGKGPVA